MGNQESNLSEEERKEVFLKEITSFFIQFSKEIVIITIIFFLVPKFNR